MEKGQKGEGKDPKFSREKMKYGGVTKGERTILVKYWLCCLRVSMESRRGGREGGNQEDKVRSDRLEPEVEDVFLFRRKKRDGVERGEKMLL